MKSEQPTLEFLASRLEEIAADVRFLRETVERMFPGNDSRRTRDGALYQPRSFQSDK